MRLSRQHFSKVSYLQDKTKSGVLMGVSYISVTYEMRTTEYGEICISIDTQTIVERAFKQNGKKGKESKVAERQRERECVCVSVDQNR